MTTRLALLGAGRIGVVHARAIQAMVGAELVAVFDVYESAANNLIADFGGELRDIEVYLAYFGIFRSI